MTFTVGLFFDKRNVFSVMHYRHWPSPTVLRYD